MTILWECTPETNPTGNSSVKGSWTFLFFWLQRFGIFLKSNPPLFMSLAAFIDINVHEDMLYRIEFTSLGDEPFKGVFPSFLTTRVICCEWQVGHLNTPPARGRMAFTAAPEEAGYGWRNKCVICLVFFSLLSDHSLA